MAAVTQREEGKPLRLDLCGSEAVDRLIAWYLDYGRPLPWRARSASAKTIRDPWLVLVSETMLQQTQADHVVSSLASFLDRYPTPSDLAESTTADVLRKWKGLGYNSRALRLRDAAIAICSEHGGEVPDRVELLRQLPGVGEYTARAVACFAFGIPVPVVDVNVARVLTRLFFPVCDTGVSADAARIHSISSTIVDRWASGSRCDPWHQGLMDLGAGICRAGHADCDACPLSEYCASAHVVGTRTTWVSARTERTSEPSFRGRPRRLVRGAIVETLRAAPEGVSFDELIERLYEEGLDDRVERSAFGQIVERLVAEGVAGYSSSGQHDRSSRRLFLGDENGSREP